MRGMFRAVKLCELYAPVVQLRQNSQYHIRYLAPVRGYGGVGAMLCGYITQTLCVWCS